MAHEDYKPRFVFEITAEQKERADRLIGQYGLRKSIFQPILDDVLDIVERHGGLAIGLMISNNVKPHEIIKSIANVEKVTEELSHGRS